MKFLPELPPAPHPLWRLLLVLTCILVLVAAVVRAQVPGDWTVTASWEEEEVNGEDRMVLTWEAEPAVENPRRTDFLFRYEGRDDPSEKWTVVESDRKVGEATVDYTETQCDSLEDGCSSSIPNCGTDLCTVTKFCYRDDPDPDQCIISTESCVFGFPVTTVCECILPTPICPGGSNPGANSHFEVCPYAECQFVEIQRLH